MNALAVIPARFGSTRFPGKPLADRTGKPLIQHVVEQVRRAQCVVRIIVATDDRRIADAVRGFGSEAMMTRADHPNGTSRIAEVVERLADDADAVLPGIVVNVQGDEPQIEPHVIDELVDGLANDREAPMATLASPFADGEDPADPNIVKLVVNRADRAMYFSRSVIPYVRGAPAGDAARASGSPLKHQLVTILKHPGLYAYRTQFLAEYVALPPTSLEQAEQLEQLRALEHGIPIAVIRTRVSHHGIDTPEQYERFVQQYAAERGSG